MKTIQTIPIDRAAGVSRTASAPRTSSIPRTASAPHHNRRPQQTRRPQTKRQKRRGRTLLFVLKAAVLFLLCTVVFLKGKELLNETYFEEIAATPGLPSDLSPEYQEKLLMLAGENKTVQEILAQQSQYPARLLELAVNNPEAIDFVAAYPDRQDTAPVNALPDTQETGSFPLYLQWDQRWGYDSYGSGMIALDGCGPTCLSMVYAGLTGDTSLHPGAMADFSEKEGFVTSSAATSWELMTDGAAKLGLSSRELPLDENLIKNELASGHPVICSMGPGDFTTKGHFILFTGITEDGRIIVNDPNSRLRSEKTWELSDILYQIKNLWSFSV